MTSLFWRLLKTIVGAVVLCGLPGLSWAQGAAAPEPKRIAVRAARLFDGKSDKLLSDAVLLIEGSTIQAVGTGLAIPAGARVIDLGNVTLMPGLIDAHSHLLLDVPEESGDGAMLSTIGQRSTADRALMGVKLGLEMLEAGVTTVRDVGNSGPMARKRIFLVPTDGPIDMCDSFGAKIGDAERQRRMRERCRKLITKAYDRIRRAVAAGVRLAAGSDMYIAIPGLTRGQASVQWFSAYVEAGVKPVDVLRAATMNAAELLRMQDRIGSVEANKLADLLAVEGDPLKDIGALKQVRFVMKDGQLILDARSPEGGRARLE